MRFRAAVLTGSKNPLVLEELQVPKLRPGQVLVQLVRSGICGAQLSEIDGAAGSVHKLPRLLGHEGAGWIHDRGPGVSKVKPGDLVVLHPRPGRGMQAEPAQYRSRALGIVHAGPVTTFNEYAVVSEDRTTPIPPDFDPELGALMGCAVTTGLGVINDSARIRFGESVVVFGAGGVGLNIVQGAALASAGHIVAIDVFEGTLALALKFGATHAVNARKEKIPQAVLDIIGPRGADVVVDNTGGTDAPARCKGLARPGGRIIILGASSDGSLAARSALSRGPKKTLSDSHGGGAASDQEILRYVALNLMGKLPLSGLVTARYRLDKINDALKDIRDGKVAGRCMLIFR